MTEIQKLNKTFTEDQVLDSSEMNNITSKIDEVIEEVNNNENTVGGSSIEDAPSDGNTYGRKDGKWTTVEGITQLSFDSDMQTIMLNKLDNITTPGKYIIKSPNYYCEGTLEVANVNGDMYESVIIQTLRITDSITNNIIANYAYRKKYKSNPWGQWVKSNNDGTNDLGEITFSIDDISGMGTSPFDDIKKEGIYIFSNPNYYGEGILEVTSFRNSFIVQRLRTSIAEDKHPFDNNGNLITTDIPYTTRLYENNKWGAWNKNVENEIINLGELFVTYDNPFPSKFDDIFDEGEYKFTLPHYYGSGNLKVYKVADKFGSSYLMTKQVIYMDITSSSKTKNFENNTTSIIYAVRIYVSGGIYNSWSPWKKVTQTLE